MDAAEELSRPDDAPRPTGAERIERAAARAIDAGQAEHMHRQPMRSMKLEPSCLRLDPAPAAQSARVRRGSLVDPVAAAIAIDPGRGKIADPAEPPELGKRVAKAVDDRIAQIIRRHR